ncbi:MAG: JAB domain-containing protein [Chlorobi bacterium]|nr:JAB domain-containing protein [Chlorobiota bacterium]
MSIKNWHEDERPREKLMKHGARALSVAELIAILLGSGTKEKSAVDVARELLQSVDYDLSRLEHMNPDRLRQFKGIGPARAVLLNAVFELGRRRAVQSASGIKKISSAADVDALLRPMLAHLPHEEFWVVFLRKNQLLGTERISTGGLDFSAVDMRLFWKRVLDRNATGIILVHNHPSGNTSPSRDDIALTRRIRDAARLLQVEFLDHIIITPHEYQSILPYL